MPSMVLPGADWALRTHVMGPASAFPLRASPVTVRIVYAAARVVMDPWASANSWSGPVVDWEATMRFRHRPRGLGLMVAEVMEMLQRGMGLDWPGAKELIRRSLADSRTVEGTDLACGVGTGQLGPARARRLDDVLRAYEK